MSHYRVIPRDFFNEAKLLKCLGRFQLCIHDRLTKFNFEVEFDGKPFLIHLNDHNNCLICLNYRVFLDGHELTLYTPYNSKENYPLLGLYKGEEYFIFDEDGNFMPNFGK